MSPIELRLFLAETGLSASDFAKLVDVTPRAVAMWLASERAIPGPAASYARVFLGLSRDAQRIERLRLKESEVRMRDGMYAVQYQSVGGAGYATMILDGGKAYGADPFGGKYDGHYDYDPETGMAKVRLKVTFAPNVPSVLGPAQPFEWSIDIIGDIDPRLDRGLVVFATPLGPKLEAQYQFLRDVPMALAAP